MEGSHAIGGAYLLNMSEGGTQQTLYGCEVGWGGGSCALGLYICYYDY